MHRGMRDVRDYEDLFSIHPCQPFCRDYFLPPTYSLLSLKKFSPCQKQPLKSFVRLVKDGLALLLVYQ